eukprot:m51a1_g6679 hypothetical protein (109) ;mRNA; f:223969-224365
MNEEEVSCLVCNWAPSYKYCVGLEVVPTNDEERRWVVTWSKPTPQRPIPEAVARVHIRVAQRGASIEYQIENQRYVHHLGQSAHFSERWIDAVIEQKIAARDVMKRTA